MKVFNPGATPVPVDGGRVVAAGGHADISDGPRARAAIDRGLLVDQTPPPTPAPEVSEGQTEPAASEPPAKRTPRASREES